MKKFGATKMLDFESSRVAFHIRTLRKVDLDEEIQAKNSDAPKMSQLRATHPTTRLINTLCHAYPVRN